MLDDFREICRKALECDESDPGIDYQDQLGEPSVDNMSESVLVEVGRVVGRSVAEDGRGC